MIPKIIHQTWKSEIIPDMAKSWVQSWKDKHSEWRYKLWTDSMCYDLVNRYYPTLLSLYQNYPYNIQRVDVIRYLVLYLYGGLYADLDTECLKSFDELMDTDFLIGYQTRRTLCNALFGSIEGNPVLFDIIVNLPEAFEKSKKFVGKPGQVLNSTGNSVITPIIEKYHRREPDKSMLLEKKYFYPFSWKEKNLAGGNFPDSYAKHYWIATWFKKGH